MNNDPTAVNSVILQPDNYIDVKLVGDQNYLSIDAIRKEVASLVEELKFNKKDIIGLVDLSAMTGFNTGSNKAAFEILEQIPYKKVAMCGGNTAITTVTNLLIQALGKDDRTKLFKDHTEALNWLLS